MIYNMEASKTEYHNCYATRKYPVALDIYLHNMQYGGPQVRVM